MSTETEAPEVGLEDADDFDGAAAFLASFDKKEEPAEGEPQGEPAEGSAEPVGEPDPDDAEVEWKVGEEARKATLRDLLQNEEEMNSWVRTIPGASGLQLMQ